MLVIDLYGLSEEEVRRRFGAVWQHSHSTVKQQTDAIAQNGPDAAQYARDCWIFGKPRSELRPALGGLQRYIATVETARHRVFKPDIARRFKGSPRGDRLPKMLRTLVALGQARDVGDGRFTA